MRHDRPGSVLAPLARSWRCGLLLLIAIGSMALVWSLPPIAQDPNYHLFADRRGLFGIPNAFNVLSNLPFAAVGSCGIRLCLGPRIITPRAAWLLFFSAAALVGIGSAVYHWQPADPTLAWDRLPMAIGFMCLLTAILGDYLSPRLATLLLVPAILLGGFSVLYWQLSGDLRLYAWVQFFPLVMLPPLMLLLRGRHTHSWLLAAACACYLAAKFAELYDRELFAWSREIISGHSLKHLLAATGLYALVLMVKQRKPRDAAQP
jgi:hypothetical protein